MNKITPALKYVFLNIEVWNGSFYGAISYEVAIGKQAILQYLNPY